ncbi:hypothetical protein BGV40_01570 [Methanosarcina sp. Ant1]|nr:hypothetical protein BGV40_01570 [Methanosarcina sp. Ant1]
MTAVPPLPSTFQTGNSQYKISSDFRFPLENLLWKISFGKSPLENLLWKISFGKSPLENLLWKISFGKSPLENFPVKKHSRLLSFALLIQARNYNFSNHGFR